MSLNLLSYVIFQHLPLICLQKVFQNMVPLRRVFFLYLDGLSWVRISEYVTTACFVGHPIPIDGLGQLI